MSISGSESLPKIELLKLKNGDVPLRILTFNIWLSGTQVENGLCKIAKHINLLQPDIVALQVRSLSVVDLRFKFPRIREYLLHPIASGC